MSGLQICNENKPEKKRKVRARKYGPDAFLPHSNSPVPVQEVPEATPPGLVIHPIAPTSEFPSPTQQAARGRGRGGGGGGGRGRGRASGTPRVKRSNVAQSEKPGTSMGSSIGKNKVFEISVDNGEDICLKICSTVRSMHQNIYIISADGCVSKVTMRQDDPLKTITYEGQFGIKILSGIVFHPEAGKGSGLSTVLARLDGHTISGMVSSELIAKGSVKVLASNF